MENRKIITVIVIIFAAFGLLTFAYKMARSSLLTDEGMDITERTMTFEDRSSALQSIVIIPAMESPMADHSNVIWCSSFQLAWDELKDGIVKEAVMLDKNQSIADLLNQAKQSRHDMSDGNVYARAGFVKDHIIQVIQTEILRQFPQEPIPSFDDVTSATAIIVYSRLTANVRFTLPYFENNEPLVFTDSHGNQAAVTSFGIREKDDYAYDKLREQVNILFLETENEIVPTEFALDLCKTSSPDQIVLAMVKPKSTFLETFRYVEEKSKQYFRQPQAPEFGPNDVLLVPNLYWKITHTFTDLQGSHLQNSGFENMPIEKAMQVIQFRLDRSGAKLKSESKLYCAPMPRHFIFDRPFFIYMKKRVAKYPFFIMWVDNAELLEK